METITTVLTPDNLRYIFAGFFMTLKVAGIAIVLSVIIGTVFGLIRNYDKFILKKIVGFYVEMFRNTPNLLWVFVCFIAAPFPTAFQRCCCAYVLFTSAMMAEIVRGGLNAIPKGQFEAAASQGFSFIGTLWYIVIPQCFRKILPTMMSQITTVIKDTSFLAQVGMGELLFNTKDLQSKLYIYTGHSVTFAEMCVLFGFAALLYFIVNFTLSSTARWLQRHQDKGQGVSHN